MERLLSAGGKDILIKSVAQAVPIYSMACFLLPKGLCDHINGLIRKFWWGSREGERKPCWVSWREMCKPKSLGGLGFKDMELFNLALLARQGWRMLQNPAALSTRILKAKYFPDTDMMQAELGSSPSQVWRGIHEGIQVLKQGLVRRIGTGEHTDPYNDNWLPRDGMLRPMACLARNPPHAVADLIDSSSATWNEEKLRECFLPMDVDVIKEIPLPSRRHDDFWAWHYERKGVFSVRSAYRMLVDTRERREAWLDSRATSSNEAGIAREWSSLWKTQVPSKIRVFLWRLAKQSLPSNELRHRRGMADDDRCQLCGACDSWRHALLDCSMSRCVWALLDEEVTEHVSRSDDGDARAWVAGLIQSLKHDDLTKVLVTLWAIWHARRKAIHEQIFQSPLSVHMFVESFVSDLKRCEDLRKKQPATAPEQRTPGWIPPPRGMIKINVDAAVGKNSGRGTVAAIARTENGGFMGASTLVLPGKSSAEILEALACREACALAKDIHVRRIMVATDCMNVVTSLAEGTLGSYAHIVREIRESKGDFDALEFRHEARSSNKEAHCLARSAVYDAPGRRVWLVRPPEGFLVSITSD
jgi:ribonuclease HI